MDIGFRKDLHREELLRPYLDSRYAAHGITVSRYTATSDQLRGMDIQLTKDGRSFIVDEKAQLHYLNRSLNTFALELSLLKDGTERVGWFLDPSKRTEVYSFVFDIRSRHGANDIRSPRDITAATIVLVNRERLLRSLANVGLDDVELQRLCREVRVGGPTFTRVQFPGIRILRSDRLTEAPVNLLVARKHLMGIGQVLLP